MSDIPKPKPDAQTDMQKRIKDLDECMFATSETIRLMGARSAEHQERIKSLTEDVQRNTITRTMVEEIKSMIMNLNELTKNYTSTMERMDKEHNETKIKVIHHEISIRGMQEEIQQLRAQMPEKTYPGQRA